MLWSVVMGRAEPNGAASSGLTRADATEADASEMHGLA
jgi:hypothetical protein